MKTDYTPGELDRTAPARIWLQIDTTGNNADRDDPWAGSEGVTWQDDSIGGLEIQYVRADLAAQPASSADGQGVVRHSVLQVGSRGAAYDPPNTHRAFTYDEQPGNGIAWRLGEAARSAAGAAGGDLIDGGLSLLKSLQVQGFGVFQIGSIAAPVAAEAAPSSRLQDIADAAAALDVRGDKKMASRLMRLHSAMSAEAAPQAVDLEAVRTAVANYMRSEGCSCCRDLAAHEIHAARLAELLQVPSYSDGSGFDFALFRTPKESSDG